MKIACIDEAAASQVLNTLQRHGVTRGISWLGGSPLDERIWIVMTVRIDPTVEATIRRDIDSIAGAKVQE